MASRFDSLFGPDDTRSRFGMAFGPEEPSSFAETDSRIRERATTPSLARLESAPKPVGLGATEDQRLQYGADRQSWELQGRLASGRRERVADRSERNAVADSGLTQAEYDAYIAEFGQVPGASSLERENVERGIKIGEARRETSGADDTPFWTSMKKAVQNLDDQIGGQGGGGIIQALPETMRFLGAATGNMAGAMVPRSSVERTIEEAGQGIRNRATREIEGNSPELSGSPATQFAYDLVGAFSSLATAVGVTVATKNPQAGIGALGAMSFGTKFGQSIDAGRNREEAFMDGAVYGLAEMVGENKVLGAVMKPGGTLAGKIGAGAVGESLQEGLTSVIQNGYDVGILREDMTMGEFARAVTYDMALGAAAGGAVAGVAHPFTRNRGAVFSPPEAERPIGFIETASTAPAPVTPEDETSPLPTERIAAGRQRIAAVAATPQANEILSANQAPEIHSRVQVIIGGQAKEGVVEDAFTREDGDGIKVKLDDGTVFDEYFDNIRDAGVAIIAVRRAAEEEPVEPPQESRGRKGAQGGATLGMGRDAAIRFVMRRLEGGGQRVVDSGGATRYGISQKAHPEVDIDGLTEAKATQIYINEYWDKLGLDYEADPNFALAVFDTAINHGTGTAARMARAAGGDTSKLLALRRQAYANLIAGNREKYGRYEKGWKNRLATLESALGAPATGDAAATGMEAAPTQPESSWIEEILAEPAEEDAPLAEPAPLPDDRLAERTTEPVLRVDNPGGDWLADKREDAEAAYQRGISGRVRGPITAYTEKIMLDPKFVSSIPAARDEKRAPGDSQYDKLSREVDAKGYSDKGAVLIGVNYRGEPYVIEGNTRAAVARDKGVKAIPAIVRYFAGGEQQEGGLTPAALEAAVLRDDGTRTSPVEASTAEDVAEPTETAETELPPATERPLAAEGLTSYRYRGRYGWVMIGAKDNAEALSEAQRSVDDPISPDNLEIWSGDKYVPAATDAVAPSATEAVAEPAFDPAVHVEKLRAVVADGATNLNDMARLGKKLGLSPVEANAVLGAVASRPDAGFYMTKGRAAQYRTIQTGGGRKKGTKRVLVSEAVQPRYQRTPRREGPVNIVTFLRDRGGLQEGSNDLSRGRGFRTRFPGLISGKGRTADEALELAVDAGYFPTRERQDYTVDDLLQAVEENRFRPEDQGQAKKPSEAPQDAREKLDAALKDEALRAFLPSIIAESDKRAIVELMQDEGDATTAGDPYAAAPEYFLRRASELLNGAVVETGSQEYEVPFEVPRETGSEGQSRDDGAEASEAGERQARESEDEGGGEEARADSGENGDVASRAGVGETGDVTSPATAKATGPQQTDAFGERPEDKRVALERRGEGRKKATATQKPPDSEGGLFDDTTSRQLDLEKDALAQAKAALQTAMTALDKATAPQLEVVSNPLDRATVDSLTSFLSDSRPLSEKYQVGDVLTLDDEIGEVIKANARSLVIAFPSGEQIVQRDTVGLEPATPDQWRSIEQPKFSRVEPVDTPEFRAWFRDSAVVDENGAPLVVYHGTDREFEAFDPTRRGETMPGADKAGFFFTTTKIEAEGWARGDGTGKPRVISAYVSLQNPLEISAKDDDPTETWYLNRRAYEGQAREGGHDGVIVSNDWGDKMVLAFEPSQIKSTDNIGTFDPADDRIMFRRENGIIAPVDAETAARWRDKLQAEMKRLGIDDRILLEVVGKSEFGDKVAGAYWRRTVTVALDVARDPLAIFSHESIHAMKSLGLFRPSEWTALSKLVEGSPAMKDVRRRYPDLTAEQQVEEAIADLYGYWRSGRESVKGFAAKALQRIRDLFATIKAAFQGETTPGQVFRDIEAGKIGRREGQASEAEGPMFSGDAFAAWFGDSKVVDANGAPLVVYHGTKAPIDKFSTDSKIRTGRYFSEGVYLTKGKYDAEKYAGNGGQVISAYASLQNPFIEGESSFNGGRALVSTEMRPDLIRKAYEKAGFDGVILQRGWVIAFEPSQIKSASNRGTWDPSDDRIMFARGVGSLSEELERARTLTTAGKFQEKLDRWRTAMQDRMLPLLRAQAAAERVTGRELGEDEQPYRAEELMTGRTGAQLEKLEASYNRLFEALGEEKITAAELESYLYARHAPERNKSMAAINPAIPNGSGMSDIEAGAIIKRVTDAGKLDGAERLAKHVDDILAQAVETRVEAGLMTQEQADEWRGRWKHYVPLKGFAELPDADDRPSVGSGISVRGPETKRAFGRRSMADDIIAHAIMQAEEAVFRAEKNRVAQELYRLAESVPDPDFWATNKVTTKKRVNDATGLVETYAVHQLTAEDAPYTVSMKIDGKERRVTFNRRNPDAVRAAESMRRLNEPQVNSVIAVLSKVNRWLSAANTSLNPEFVITNAFRDLQSAAVNLAGIDIKGLEAGTLRDWRKGLFAATKGAFGKEEGEWGKWWREFVDEGGRTFYNSMQTLDEMRRDMERRMDPNRRPSPTGLNVKPKQLALIAKEDLKAVFGFIDNVNTGIENAVRLSVYKNARELGASKKQAASLAKNLTVNFNRRGAHGVVMNSLFLFYNASIQGSVRILMALKHRRVRQIVAGIVVAGALQEMLNMALSDEDDDGELIYDKLDEFEKQGNMIFMVKGPWGDYLKLPMPWGYRAFHVLGRNLVAMGRGRPAGPATWNIIRGFVESFNPVGGTNSVMNFLAPTLVDPVVDLSQNRDFAGRPIMPDQSQFEPEKPMNQRYWNNVGPQWKAVTDFLNSATGGDEVVPGAVDVSPEALEYLFGVATGAAGAFVDRTAGLGAKLGQLADGDPNVEISINDIPIARKLVGSKPQWFDKAAFYARLEHIDETAERRKGYIGDLKGEVRDPEGLERFEQDEQDVLAVTRTAKWARKKLRETKKERGILEAQHDAGRVEDADFKAETKRLDDLDREIMTTFSEEYLLFVEKPRGPAD